MPASGDTHHRLVVTDDDASTSSISKGGNIPRLGHTTTYEKTLIINQQVIQLAKEE